MPAGPSSGSFAGGGQLEPPRPGLGRQPGLPRRGRHQAAAEGAGYGRNAGYGQSTGFGQNAGYGQNTGYGGDMPPGPDTPPGQDPGARQESPPTGWIRPGGRPVSRPPWEDPALQDFFAPQPPRTGTPPPGNGRLMPGATAAGSGLPGRPAQPDPALPGSGLPGPGLPGGRSGPATASRRSRKDGWGAPQDAPAVPPRRADTPPAKHTSRRDPASGGGRRRIIVIAAVVAVVVIAGVVLLTRKPGSSSTGASMQPTLTPTTPAGTKAAATGPTATPAASGPVYTLSTPATAGGLPMGQDPHFLAAATTTAQAVVSAVSSGGGGTVQGSPVSASYQLPTGEQVVEFVGYQGTFDPTKVAAILASLGSDPHLYPAGSHGGILGCANTPTSPSGAVCVWATTSTLGFTEFFNVSGPETLTASQSKGAQIVVKLRSGVETAKS